MKINKITAINNNYSICTRKAQNAKKNQNRCYAEVPSFWGRDLLKQQQNPIPTELQSIMPIDTTIQGIIEEAQCKENILGQGANSIVYNIPQLDGYVLKVLNKDDPNKINMNEFPSDVNLGQPVWQDDKNPRLLILKKINGKEHSIPNWSATVGTPLQITTAQSKQFLKQLSIIAKMPQKAFDQLAKDVKLLDDKGYKLDSINPNNLIVDEEKEEMHIIDYFKVKPSEAHLYRNSYLDLIAVMSDFTLFPEYFDKMNDTEKIISSFFLKGITYKTYNACEKAGLSCDNERYKTYINETSKWFPIQSVKNENTGSEYVRAYNVRMQDFINMIYNSDQWADNR